MQLTLHETVIGLYGGAVSYIFETAPTFLRCPSQMPHIGKEPLSLYNLFISVQPSPSSSHTSLKLIHPSLPNPSPSSSSSRPLSLSKLYEASQI